MRIVLTWNGSQGIYPRLEVREHQRYADLPLTQRPASHILIVEGDAAVGNRLPVSPFNVRQERRVFYGNK
jgi:hypothetical protein